MHTDIHTHTDTHAVPTIERRKQFRLNMFSTSYEHYSCPYQVYALLGEKDFITGTHKVLDFIQPLACTGISASAQNVLGPVPVSPSTAICSVIKQL